MAKSNSTGFTLAELLIALAILGVIATFTIPKVLQSFTDNQKRAVYRETVAMISSTMNDAMTLGIPPAEIPKYMRDHFNYVKHCPADSAAEGCWDATIQGSHPNYSDRAGITLANGAIVLGVDPWPNDMGNGAWCKAYMIDWNGIHGPNVGGDDLDGIIFNYGSKTDTNPASWCYNIRPGTFEFWNTSTNDIFK